MYAVAEACSRGVHCVTFTKACEQIEVNPSALLRHMYGYAHLPGRAFELLWIHLCAHAYVYICIHMHAFPLSMSQSRAVQEVNALGVASLPRNVHVR